MNIGVLKETGRNEHRVGLTPWGATRLVESGHRVFVEAGAGADSRYSDADFHEAGGHVVYRREEVLRRAELLLGVGLPHPADLEMLSPGQAVFGFLHLSVAPRDAIDALLSHGLTAVGYEAIEDDNGNAPILRAFGEIAGRMVIHIAAHLLENGSGGRGILLESSSGVAPATMLILGAGNVGAAAARTAAALGVHVIVLDVEPERLHRLEVSIPEQVGTAPSDPEILARLLPKADVVIGAVRRRAERPPYVITRDLLRCLRPGSVIVDLSIDEGGCVETSRPTTLDQPTYIEQEIVHYCVPNMTSNVARTASKALTLAHLAFVMEVAARGVEGACAAIPALARGVYVHAGEIRTAALRERVAR